MEQEVIQIIKDMSRDKEVYFDDPLQIKLSPHSFPINIYAAATNLGRIALMDIEGNWFELERTDLNYQVVLASLYQRLSIMNHNLKIA